MQLFLHGRGRIRIKPYEEGETVRPKIGKHEVLPSCSRREEMNEIGVKSCLDNSWAYPLCMYIRLI